MTFQEIPQFISDGSYQTTISLEGLVKWLHELVEEQELQLCPDFQRGHVWTEKQQVKFLEFLLRGGKTGRNLYFNDPYWHSVRPKTGYRDFVCVDGLQRITSIQRFLNNEIRVFGQLYSEFGGKTDLLRHSMVFHVNDLKTREDVLRWYIEMNAGGTPHSEEEIQRVRKILDECKKEVCNE